MRQGRHALMSQRLLEASTFGLLAVVAFLVSLSGAAALKQGQLSQRRSGHGRLIAFQPDPAAECEWQPASYSGSAIASSGLELASPAADQPGTKDLAARKPLRMIRDPYSAYSAVAVDTKNNEVVFTDENLFNILVYDRVANTPTGATMTEPKRMIGGLKTDIEFQCGLYIDPVNGDIYAPNGDTVEKLVIFSRQARGDVPPEREVNTPHGTYGIVADEERQEIIMTVQPDAAVVTYPKMAKGDDPPTRLLQGDHTLLADPHGIALDKKDDLIFVTNHGSVHQVRPPAPGKESSSRKGFGKQYWPLSQDNAIRGSGANLPPSITVYRRDASGDTPPLRQIQGPKTELNWPTGIAFDPRTDEIFIANDGGDEVLVFPASGSGDMAPIRVIKGAKSMVKNPTGVYIDTQNDELWVANFGNHTATVYKPTAAGDTPPLRMIRSAPLGKPVPGMGNPHPLAYDTKREQILVPN